MTSWPAAYTARGGWTKEWFTSPAGWSRTMRDFITLFSSAHNLKLIIYFWNFSFYIGPWLTAGNWNSGKRNHKWGGLWFQAACPSKGLWAVCRWCLSDYWTPIGQCLCHTSCKLFWISLLCKCHSINISWVQIPADATHSFRRLLFKFRIGILWHVLCTQFLYPTITHIVQAAWFDTGLILES